MKDNLIVDTFAGGGKISTERRNMRGNLQKARKEKGLTQQQMADKLEISLRHYQKIEYGEIGGSFDVWDALEDILGIHQRILRATSNNRPGLTKNQKGH